MFLLPLLTLFLLRLSSYEGSKGAFFVAPLGIMPLLKVFAVGFIIPIFVKNCNIIFLKFIWLFSNSKPYQSFFYVFVVRELTKSGFVLLFINAHLMVNVVFVG